MMIFLILISSFSSWSAKPPSAPKVVIQKITNSRFESRLKYPVKVEPLVNATVLAESDGVVTRLPQVGAQVKRKSALVRIQQMDPVYTFAPFSVLAPVDGQVSEIFVSEGTQINRGQRLLTITDPTKTRLVAEITAEDLSLFKLGQRGVLKDNSLGEIPVEVVGVSPLINPATGTATCVLKTLEKIPLIPGSVSQVEFRFEGKEALYVPKASVLYKGLEPYLRLIEGDRVRHQTIKLGSEKNEVVEVIEGLSSSQEIVVRSSSFLASGQSFEVESRIPSSEANQTDKSSP